MCTIKGLFQTKYPYVKRSITKVCGYVVFYRSTCALLKLHDQMIIFISQQSHSGETLQTNCTTSSLCVGINRRLHVVTRFKHYWSYKGFFSTSFSYIMLLYCCLINNISCFLYLYNLKIYIYMISCTVYV